MCSHDDGMSNFLVAVKGLEGDRGTTGGDEEATLEGALYTEGNKDCIDDEDADEGRK